MLAQHKLLHLAACRQRIALHKLEVARNLMVTNPALAIVPQFLLGQLFSLVRDDHCQQFLAEEGIWDAHHLDIGDLGMADQKLLDLTREEVFADTNDHIFEPTHDVKVALCVHSGQVARMQPALDINRLGCLLRHMVVPFHCQETAIAQFASLPDRHDLARRRVGDFEINMWQRSTHCCRFQFERVI